MISNKVGRPGKPQRICSQCLKPCSPKDGDWFYSDSSGDAQKFICKPCEKLVKELIHRSKPLR